LELSVNPAQLTHPPILLVAKLYAAYPRSHVYPAISAFGLVIAP